MELIKITQDNLEQEHICCAISNNKDIQVMSKKAMQEGFTLYYTSQCPFTAKYVPLLEEMAKSRNVDFQVVHIQTREEAQNAPTPFTTFSLFYRGEFITHEILSEKKFENILASKGL